MFSALMSPVSAETLVVNDPHGAVTIPENPTKVITFDLATLDDLAALGVRVEAVKSGRMPARLAQYENAKLPHIGTLFEPDYEAVNAARPDLIIVAGRSSPKYAALAKIAPTLDLTIDSQHYLASSEAHLTLLGKIFHKESRAAALITKLNKSVAELHGKAGGAGRGLLVLTTGGHVSAFGEGSRFSMLFTDFGVQCADQGIKVGVHGQPVSFEYILQQNPDWLFVIDRDAAIGRDGVSAQKLLDNELVRQTHAWKTQHVEYLNAGDWYLDGGGIMALQGSVDQLSKALDTH